MNPCELNVAITAVANYFYATLSSDDFRLVHVLLSELSKTMHSMEILRGICVRQAEDNLPERPPKIYHDI